MYDDYGDLTDRLDRQLLERAEPPSHVHARQLLEENSIVVKTVVRANPDSILYVNGSGVAMTAWTHTLPNGHTRIVGTELGFAANPTPYLQDEQEPDGA
jgi:hypothetical protein